MPKNKSSKNTTPSAASSDFQKTLDSLLIHSAISNPGGAGEDITKGILNQNVTELLARGANVNAANDGFTVLMMAAYNGHIGIVSNLLLRDGIDVDVKRPDGFTALMLAAKNGHTAIVTLLSSHPNGIDVNATRPNGVTALMLAALNGHAQIVSYLLSRRGGINVDAVTPNGFTALILAAEKGHAKTVLALLSRNDVDWQIVQDQLRHPALRNLNKEVSVLLAVALPEGETRNSIITSFNQRNPENAIQQENNDILGAGPKAYKNLKDLESWYKKYLTDSGAPENEVEILANQKFFKLLNDQDYRQEALARNDLVKDLLSKSTSLAIGSKMIAKEIKIGDQLDDSRRLNPEQLVREALNDLSRLEPEDLYKLTTEIIYNSKAAKSSIAELQALSLVAVLKNFEIYRTTPARTIMHRDSTASIAAPIVTTQRNERDF